MPNGTVKNWMSVEVSSAIPVTIPLNSGIQITHLNGGTGTVTVKNVQNNSSFTLIPSETQSFNWGFYNGEMIITATGDSLARVIYW